MHFDGFSSLGMSQSYIAQFDGSKMNNSYVYIFSCDRNNWVNKKIEDKFYGYATEFVIEFDPGCFMAYDAFKPMYTHTNTLFIL